MASVEIRAMRTLNCFNCKISIPRGGIDRDRRISVRRPHLEVLADRAGYFRSTKLSRRASGVSLLEIAVNVAARVSRRTCGGQRNGVRSGVDVPAREVDLAIDRHVIAQCKLAGTLIKFKVVVCFPASYGEGLITRSVERDLA